MKFSDLKLQLMLLFIFCMTISQAQEIDLPDSLFINLEKTEYKINDTLRQEFYIEYPKEYNDSIKYPVFIGLAGGNQSQDFVLYCYVVYFNTSILDNYIKIFPIGVDSDGIMSSSKDYYMEFLQQIQNNQPCLPNDWIIAGTSNGGIAALEIVSVKPSLFKGIITMPGIIYGDNIFVNKNWNHLKVLLVYGENDSDGWIQGVYKTDSVFKDNSMLSKTLMLSEQGHILNIGYDINKIYIEFFDLFE